MPRTATYTPSRAAGVPLAGVQPGGSQRGVDRVVWQAAGKAAERQGSHEQR